MPEQRARRFEEAEMAEWLRATSAPVRAGRSRLAAFRAAHPDVDVAPGPCFWEAGYRSADGRMASKARHELPVRLDDLEEELRETAWVSHASMGAGPVVVKMTRAALAVAATLSARRTARPPGAGQTRAWICAGVPAGQLLA
jgi:hypothetical protein